MSATIGFGPRRAAALLAGVLVLAVAGCGGDGDEDKTTPTTATPTTTTPGTGPAGRILPAAWYADPDGDLVPTAVEEENGTDPDVDECAQEAGCASSGVNALENSNTLLILDSSGSMAGTAGGGTSKLEAAKEALRGYVAGTPDSVALGFMVLGHKGANNEGGKAASCAGVELLLPIGTAASKRFDATLDRFTPKGYTPLAAALREARGAFAGKESGVNRIILVTDGVETCGGDPVAEARKLKDAGIGVTTDVVGFDVAKADEARRLRDIAEASGGTYSNARTASALKAYFKQALDAYEELSREYVCVFNSAGKISTCRSSATGKALITMIKATNEATGAEADEIKRLRSKLYAASRARAKEATARTKVTIDRLLREIKIARARYESLSK